MSKKNTPPIMNIDELRVYLNRKTGIEREPIIAFLKTEPTESLIHYLTDENSLIRNYSAEVLGEMRNKGVVPSLIKHLETDDEELQDKIIEALGKIGDSRAFQPILNLFLNGNLNFRGAIALGELGDKRAIPVLLKGLQSKNPFLRTCAAYGLAKFKNTTVPDLIKCLREKESLVRGKALGILGKIWMENGFPGENVLNSIILQLNDETLWVREVTAEVLRLWSEAHPLIIFQKMKNLILSNVESINAPSTGNGVREYATRIMLGIYKKHEGDATLTGEFTAFLDQLGKLYEENKTDTANALAYKKNLLQIMLYITSFLRLETWPWGAETEALVAGFPNRPQRCWTCEHWQYWQVPSEELQAYLKSDNYRELKVMLFETEDIEAIDDITGMPLDENAATEISMHFSMFGYCMAHHEVRDADSHSALFSPRSLQFPIDFVQVVLDVDEMGDFLLWVKVDATMREQLRQWLEEHPPVRSKGGGIAAFLAKTALECTAIRTLDHSKYGSAIHYRNLINVDKDTNDYEPPYEEPFYLWNTQGSPQKYLLSNCNLHRDRGIDVLTIEDLERILHGTLYTREYSDVIQAELYYD